MKKYQVVLHPDAETDISSAFEWGRRAWGEEEVRTWVRQLYRHIKTHLTSTPLRCPLAPESGELEMSVRPLIIGRYRILFIVERKTVTVLHLKSSYVGPLNRSHDVEGKN
jgi:plasmid stabilization system protein ParE